MAIIFSPLSEDVLEGPFEPLPRSAFVMLQLGDGRAKIESEMQATVISVLKAKRFKPVDAESVRGNKDYLEKIIQIIRGSGYGVAIFSEYTPPSTLANIFFEVALCNLLGKPVILAKTKDARAPSDFVRTEWVTYHGQKTSFRKEIDKSVRRMTEIANFYEKLGDIALEADEGDLELAFERYKQTILISGKKAIRPKLKKIQTRLNVGKQQSDGLGPSARRLRMSVREFLTLLP